MSSIEFLQDWFRGKSQKILSTSAFLLVAVLSFVGGTLFQKDQVVEESKLVITVPDYEAKKQTLTEEQKGALPAPGEGSMVPIAKEVTPNNVGEAQANCPYVGSKNSDKYHLASCGVVKRIKPENRRCFASPQVAEASGYMPGCAK